MGSGAGDKAPWKLRLRAWWEGVDVPVPEGHLPSGKAEPTLSVKPAEPPIPPLMEWETDTIRIQQQVWGEGYYKPGGEEYLLGLAKPFGLNPSLTVMEFGAGLGGGTRALVNEFGVWVNGLEPTAEIAKAGKEMSIKAGMEKKADIIRYNPDGFEPKAGSVDCILSSESLYLVEDKLKILKTFERCLKSRGQISITDFVRRDDIPADDPRLQGLGLLPTDVTNFASGEEYVRWLRELNFDLRVNEDITERYRKMIMDGWVDFTQAGGQRAAHARAMPDPLVKEVELWTRRVAAFDAGILKVMRYYAIKLGGTKLMSNW
ncbi:class I SAM-dependent methyltransferase [Dongia sp.]|uniref:class I SAM-dependent methyltransferase n=1 Tax=Dongia sp. TaxID=1977262 RepID=UPI0035ADF4ED